MDKTTVGNLCKPYVGQLRLDGDTLIDYFDIASVDNIEKQITGYTTYTLAKAPSRARKQVKRGNILVSTVRPNLNAVALFDKETENTPVVSTGFCVLECKVDTSPRFLLRYLQSKSFVRAMVPQATGASYPAVSDKIIRDAQIPAYSYEEQIQIADVLDAAANIISKRKQQLQKLDDLVKARFVELFGNPISNPMKWDIYQLEECLERIDNGKSFICSDKPRTGDNPAILKLSAATYGDYRPNENKALLDESLFVESSEVHAGDLLFTRKNTPELVGAAAYVQNTPPKLMMPDLIFRLVPNEKVNAVFLWQLINCKEFRPVIQAISGGSAKSMSNISKERLGKIKVICPPRELQDSLIPFVKRVDKSKAVIQKALDETQLLFDSLMQEYFG